MRVNRSRFLLAVVFTLGCGGKGLHMQPGKDAGLDRKDTADVAAAESDAAIDLPVADGADAAAATGEPDLVPDAPADTQERDLAVDVPADATCLSPFTPCCGMCLPPNAGVCAPCDSDGGQDVARDSPAMEGGATQQDARLACADAACETDQYCLSVYPGAVPGCMPHDDKGNCPPGTIEGCGLWDSYDGGGCRPDIPIRSCQSLPSTCTSGDPCLCLCGSAGSGIGCRRSGQEIFCAFP
jgi:hypothetical protein